MNFLDHAKKNGFHDATINTIKSYAKRNDIDLDRDMTEGEFGTLCVAVFIDAFASIVVVEAPMGDMPDGYIQ